MSAHSTKALARQSQMLEALQAVTRQVAATADLAEVLALAAQAIHTHLAYDQVAVHLTHPETGKLTLCAIAGVATSTISPSRYYLSRETSTPGQAIQTGQAIRLTSQTQLPQWMPVLDSGMVAAELSAPICVESRAIGALTVCVAQPERLGAEDEKYLTLFAEQLAAALRSADLRQRAIEREARESLLARISHAINSSLDPGQVLAQAVTVIGEQLKLDRCTLGQINLRSHTFVTEHEYVNPLLFERRSLKRPALLTETLSEIVRQLQAGDVIISAEQSPTALPPEFWEQLALRYGIRSLAWVPIPSQSRENFYTLQLMQVTHARRWNDDDLVMLRRLAEQLAIALRNAELFDDTQRSAAALKAKNTELETFVYTVSHDLQAAVASLGGFATLLQTRYQTQLDERGNMYVARIAVNAAYLGNMLRHLLELSRVGRVEEPDEVVPVGAIVEESLNDLARPLAERNVILEVPAAWPLVRYSRVRLREIFSNLLSNALKFLGPQPKPLIEIGWRRLLDDENAEPPAAEAADTQIPLPNVSAYVAPGQPASHLIEFIIRDNGIGIAPADQQRIFLPFQRLEKLNVEGTGVGLSIVKRIVEGRGGTLRIDSRAGQGATFLFTIPAAAETDELTPLGAEAAPA